MGEENGSRSWRLSTLAFGLVVLTWIVELGVRFARVGSIFKRALSRQSP